MQYACRQLNIGQFGKYFERLNSFISYIHDIDPFQLRIFLLSAGMLFHTMDAVVVSSFLIRVYQALFGIA